MDITQVLADKDLLGRLSKEFELLKKAGGATDFDAWLQQRLREAAASKLLNAGPGQPLEPRHGAAAVDGEHAASAQPSDPTANAVSLPAPADAPAAVPGAHAHALQAPAAQPEPLTAAVPPEQLGFSFKAV